MIPTPSSSWIVDGSVRRVPTRRRKCGRPPGSRDTKPRKPMALSKAALAMLARLREAGRPIPRKALAAELETDSHVARTLVRRGLAAASYVPGARGPRGKGGGRVMMLSAL